MLRSRKVVNRFMCRCSLGLRILLIILKLLKDCYDDSIIILLINTSSLLYQ